MKALELAVFLDEMADTVDGGRPKMKDDVRRMAAAELRRLAAVEAERDALKAENALLAEVNAQLREQNDAVGEACAKYEAELERIKALPPFAEVRLNKTGGNAGLSTHIVQLAEGYFPAGTKLYALGSKHD